MKVLPLKHYANSTSELLDWYDIHRRSLPWRADPGQRSNPYHVWLSEVMLQQTTVKAVKPYFERFIARWPTVENMAKAELDEVLHLWAGLGYYARARNLHKCAQLILKEYKGKFPDNEAELQKLPGIGRYTAAAISAIVFGKRATVMDVNVERVMARIYSVSDPLPNSKSILFKHASDMTPSKRAGDYVQAVMDLGATVCTVREPKCSLCPWVRRCSGKHIAENLPAKLPKPKRLTRRGIAFWISDIDGAVLLRKRPEKGLLGGMMEIPSTSWVEGDLPDKKTAVMEAPLHVETWEQISGIVKHTFSHFNLELHILVATVAEQRPLLDNCIWCQPKDFEKQPLPTVMRKIAQLCLAKF